MATKLRFKVLSLACSRASFLLACGMSAALACSSDGGGRDHDPGSDDTTVAEIETGSIQLPLTTRGASGALYRLRNAVFQIEQISSDPFPNVPPPTEPPVFPEPFPEPPIFFPDDGIGIAGSSGTAGAGNFDLPPDGAGGWDGSTPPSMGGSSSDPGSGPIGTGGTVGMAGSVSTGGFAGSGVAGAAGAAGAGGGPATGGSAGASSGFVTFLFSENDPFSTTLETTLPVGRYLITLLDGWNLERVFGSDVTVVDARLESSASQEFSIFINEESFVLYSFSTNGEIVSFGDGRLIVDIEVNENQGGGGDDPRLTVMENAREALPFTLEDTLGLALSNAGSSLDPLSAYHGIIDSYAPADGGRDPSLAHCDDELTGGAPSLNGFSLQCGRLEAEQFDNLDSWFAIAASNRLDLAPADGANCGQQRIIFANNNFIGNGRMFIILESVVPNPDPGCGVAACAPIASFWTNLAAITDPFERGNRLREAFLTGSPELLAAGFAPFMNAQHLGPDGGQIRTNNFNDSPWTLREFHFVDIEEPPLPQPVAESPNGELWNDLSPLPQGEACRESFLRAASLGLASNELNALSFPVDQACKDAESRNDFFTEDYGFHLSQGSGEFRARLDEIGAPLGLTADDLAARARFGGSCMGCHQEAGGSSLGNGLSAPFQGDFVHVSEFGLETCGNGGSCFGISEALRTSFLPTRARITRNLASFPGCGSEEPPIDPIPGDGGSADGGVSAPGSLPARTVAPGSGVRFTLGGQVVDGHAH
jgi:hypothetical protein